MECANVKTTAKAAKTEVRKAIVLIVESPDRLMECCAACATGLGGGAPGACPDRAAARVCGEIVDELPLAQSTVSQHLKILRESGLIQGEVDGPKVCYCINPAKLKELKAHIAGL
jgi:DNA-binding transcriptional ArsR family regulator